MRHLVHSDAAATQRDERCYVTAQRALMRLKYENATRQPIFHNVGVGKIEGGVVIAIIPPAAKQHHFWL